MHLSSVHYLVINIFNLKLDNFSVSLLEHFTCTDSSGLIWCPGVCTLFAHVAVLWCRLCAGLVDSHNNTAWFFPCLHKGWILVCTLVFDHSLHSLSIPLCFCHPQILQPIYIPLICGSMHISIDNVKLYIFIHTTQAHGFNSPLHPQNPPIHKRPLHNRMGCSFVSR